MEDPTPSPHYEGRFLPEVEAVLRESGWFPGRVAPLDQLQKWMVVEEELENGYRLQLRMFSAAWRILREFGGLTIHQDAPELGRETFFFDPSRGGFWGDNWLFDEWQADGALFPLGNWGNTGVSDLYRTDAFCFTVTGRGEIIDGDQMQLVGNTIDEALTNLIMGYVLKPYDVPRDKAVESSYVHQFIVNRLHP